MQFLLRTSSFSDGEMNVVKCRMVVVLVCLAVSGFFVANVLATARPDGTTVTVTVPTTVPPVPTTVPTPVPTVPTTQSTTVPTTAPTVPKTVPTTTVSATTPVATVSVTTPSSIPVVTTTTHEGSATVGTQSVTRASLPSGAVKSQRQAGTISADSQGSTAGLGRPAATASSGPSTGSGSTVSGAAAASTPVVASRAGRPAVFVSRLGLERPAGPGSAIGLRLVLSRPARVRLLVIGPAPSCRVAGRLVLAGHRGVNKVAFRGRVHGRVLKPGTYTIVPQSAAGSRRLPRVVAVAIDARGIRPTAPVRWRNCEQASAAASSAVNGLPGLAMRPSGFAAAEAILPAKRERAAEKRPAAVFGWLPTLPESPQLSALLFTLLAVSIALLSLASVEPGHTLRFRPVRVIARHQGRIGWLGGALLVSAILLFLLHS